MISSESGQFKIKIPTYGLWAWQDLMIVRVLRIMSINVNTHTGLSIFDGPIWQLCDANYSSKAYATVLISTRRRSTEEIVAGPFDVEKW